MTFGDIVATSGATVTSKNLRKEFQADAPAVFLQIIRDHDGPVRCAQIKSVLAGEGVEKGKLDTAWNGVQSYLKLHPHIEKHPDHTYEWLDVPAAGIAALTMLTDLRKTGPDWLRTALADAIRRELEDQVVDAVALESRRTVGTKVDELRKVVDLAGEVEEIAYDGADADGIVARVRERLAMLHLEPIGRAGDKVKYDKVVHKPLPGSGKPKDGARVAVVRPGYTWTRDDTAVVVERAHVTAP
jgi:hypothetical protein